MLDSGTGGSEGTPPTSESHASTGGGETEAEDEAGSATEAGPGSETAFETDTSTGSETETGEPDCVPWEAAESFDQVCFSPPELVDPAPFYYLDRIDTGTPYYLYASGPDDHRVYAAVEPGADYISLSIAGVTIWRGWSGLMEPATSVLVTRSPPAILHVDFTLPDPVLAELPLEFEPRAVTWFDRATSSPGFERVGPFDVIKGFAVADAQAGLHLFELDGDALVEVGARQLPEPLDGLDHYASTNDGYRDELVGYAPAGATAYRLSEPLDDGPIQSWALAAAPTMWWVSSFSDAGPDRFMIFAADPIGVDRFNAFGDARPSSTIELDYPVDDSTGGPVPWGFTAGFVLSRDAAKLAQFGEGNGESVEYATPITWVDAPADVADIMMVGASFVCASPSEGLSVWRAM
jgi:hypothetical protein